MTIISWPYPAAAETVADGVLTQSRPPSAVIALLVRKGGTPGMAAMLEAITRSQAVASIWMPASPVAVQVLAADEAAIPVVEQAAEDYPFPLQIQIGPVDERRAKRQATNWAACLGAPEASVLVLDVLAEG
ncbi:hypothetical protein SAMN02745194_01657 [Roseomonas rosea]|jgi:Fe-S cluster assembly iron-binding protein IscA|uniref:Uncharacterized protein n=1 Tax=Muricoccus roseus TaxID=198092 RepID=A0A1M6G913_9PROT|nr:hypothetical protein [Roseomonas rosea]SHJ06419.1 hypothetical protein SAMN02745194_01657 [Roseomonas rosea]